MLFESCVNYKLSMKKPSQYNCIYYCHKNLVEPEVFGIVLINSNEYMPRFKFAYDSDEFTKEEIVKLIYYIFNPLDSENE